MIFWQGVFFKTMPALISAHKSYKNFYNLKGVEAMNITTTRTKQPFIFWCGQMIDGLPVRGHFAGTWEEFVVFFAF